MENLGNKTTLASMTEDQKKTLRNQRFNLLTDNVNTLQSIEVYSFITIVHRKREEKK